MFKTKKRNPQQVVCASIHLPVLLVAQSAHWTAYKHGHETGFMMNFHSPRRSTCIENAHTHNTTGYFR